MFLCFLLFCCFVFDLFFTSIVSLFLYFFFFFFSSRRRHTRLVSDWSSDVCSSDLDKMGALGAHEVVVETPLHDKRMSQFSDEEIERVLWVWASRIADLKKDEIGRASCRERVWS